MRATKKMDAIIEVDEETGVLTISNLLVDDHEVVTFLAATPAGDRATRLVASIRMGVVALRAAATAERVDFVEKRFQVLRDGFDKKIEEVFGPQGQLQHLISEYFDERGVVPELMEGAFGEKGQLAGIIEKQFGENGALVKDAFDPMRPGTPLAKLREEFERQFVQLRKDLALDVQAQQIAESTPQKGFDFEAEVEVMLCEAAKPLSDIVERTTEKTGSVKASKKGDFVV